MSGVAACGGGTPPPPTLRVDRGPVSTSVSASGTLTAISEQNLGFPAAGKLVEVKVKVGDTVEAGQELARLDDFDLRGQLDQANAKLANQQALLDKARRNNKVDATGRTLDQYHEILSATEDQVNATNEANSAATDRAHTQLEFDRKVLERAKERLHEAENCEPSDQTAGTGDDPTDSGVSAQTTPQPGTCPDLAAAQQAVETAKRNVIASETALSAAEQKENVDAAAGRVTVENARQQVIGAENENEAAGIDKPADTAAQDALVRDAQAARDIAQRKLDDTVLKAPTKGVVSAINGVAGEFVGASSGTTATAPGSTAKLPENSSATSTGSGSATGASGPLIVLNNVETFQLVIPIEEADAAQVAPNQAVDVTVDAIPGLVKKGSVLSISPSGTPVAGIVTFYATVVLTDSDPRLRNGQTAEGDVLTKAVLSSLRVPTAAVRLQGGSSVVDIPGPDGNPVTTPFSAGLAGVEYTEVLGGLAEGQEVLLPRVTVPAAGGGGPGGGG
ncbi:biotin/lipoyl-binding protein [Actinomycetes bacterium KLBMP 9759]